MGSLRVTASAPIPAPAPVVYRLIADYRQGHSSILPPEYFEGLQVEQGGYGSGTRIQFTMKAFGGKETSRAAVTEPQPGRVLVETVEGKGIRTRFTVDPMGPDHASVTIETDYETKGLRGLMEALLVPRYLRKVYDAELQLLATRARAAADSARGSGGAALVVLFAALCAGPVAAQAIPDAVRTAATAITAEQLRTDVHVLAADALRGRASATAGYDSAAAYITRRLTQLGLQPLGDSGTYRQHYPVRDALLDTLGTTLALGGRTLRYGADFLVRSFAESLTVTAPIVYVGHGIRAPHKGIDPYAGVDVRGAIVLVHGPFALPKGETFQSLGRVRTDWQTAPDAARSQGAIGVLYINPPAAQARWDRARAAADVHARELDPPVPSAYRRSTALALDVQAAVLDSLLAGETVGAAQLMAAAATQDYPASFALSAGKRARLRVAFASATVLRPFNVVARIEGSDPALRREAVVLLSHLDGAVGTGGVGADSIYNAADDNASGSVGTLGIAAALMRAPRPKRSVIFLWDSGEEVGLWGSRHFVTNPPVPLADMITLINVDMIGRARAAGSTVAAEAELTGPAEVYVTGPGVLSTALDSLVTRANAAYLNLTFNRRYDVATNQFFYPRTDAGPFLERGVLTLGYFTGLHGDYHGVGDGPERLDPAKMEQVARTVFVTTWMLADAPQRPAIDKGIPASVPRYGP